jgi:hypothetical protein
MPQTEEKVTPGRELGLLLGLAVGLPCAIVVLLIIIRACLTCQRRYRERDLVALPLCMNQQIVALMIDCGPSDETGKILDLLKEHDAKATFFVTGGEQIGEHQEMLQRIHDEGHELGIHPLRSGGVGSIEGLKFAELDEYIRAVEELLPANPDGAKYLRLTAALGSKENKKANKLIKELGYVLVKGEIRPVVVPARIDAGMIIPIIGREDETIRRTDEMLIRLTEEKLKAETVGGLLRVWGEQMEQTPRGIQRGFDQVNGKSRESIANWTPRPN